jgi:hypothetical protein
MGSSSAMVAARHLPTVRRTLEHGDSLSRKFSMRREWQPFHAVVGLQQRTFSVALQATAVLVFSAVTPVRGWTIGRDANAIVQRSIDALQLDWNAAPHYNFSEQDVEKHGTKTYQILMILPLATNTYSTRSSTRGKVHGC